MAKVKVTQPRMQSKCGARIVAPDLARFSISPTSKESARSFKSAGTGREGKKGKGYVYVKDTIQHGAIIAAGRTHSAGCKTKGGDARKGQVDLVFVPRSNKTGAPAGPALRFCSRKGQGFGPLLSVEDPKTAKEIAAKYQACAENTDGSESALEACVKKATGLDPSKAGTHTIKGRREHKLALGGSKRKRQAPLAGYGALRTYKIPKGRK